jgi:tight adherence protein B
VTIRRLAVLALLAVLIVGTALPVAAQESESSVEIIDVNLGRYDERGRVTMVVEFRNIETLDSGLLSVTEDGVPVQGEIEITTIAESTVEVGVVLVIDVSGSMDGEPIEAAKAAAANFVRNKRDQDFIALVTFGDEVQVLSPFRNGRSELLRLIDTLEAGGETALYDGIIRATNLFTGSAADLQPYLIVLTDGADSVSTAAPTDVLDALADRDPRLFGVALQSDEFDPAPLQSFVSATDGRYLSTTEPAQLQALYDTIQRELDNKLVVRFSSSQNLPEAVEFGVAYGTLTTSTVVEVPGFIVREPAARTTTTVTFPEAQSFTIESSAPASTSTLLWVGALSIGVSIVLLLYILFGREEEDSADALRMRLQAYGRGGRAEGQEEKGNLIARIPFLRRFTEQAEEAVRRRGLLHAMNSLLEQGNIPLSPGEAIAAGLGLSVIAGLMVGLLTRNVIPGVIATVVAVLLLFVVVQQVGEREKRKFEDQLPDTLILLSTSLRAGLSLLQAVEAVVAEAPEPTAREFGRVIAETRLGRPLVQALHGITERMRSEDWNWAVMAIEIQREVGGNLAEVLQTVADTMLQRNRLRREIRALTAEGRISAIVLAALPIVLFLVLFLTNRDYLEPLITKTVGYIAMGIGIGLMALGGVWLKKIVDIEI